MCIGVFGASPIGATTNEEFDRLVNINVKGTFYTLRAAATHIHDNGRIIVIGSNLRAGNIAGYGIPAMTKAATEVLANTLAQELGSKGVTVNTIHPGK
jgi:3-oxoacyl-[acyl-carrier protein] reductase